MRPNLESLVQLAADICGTPISLVTLVTPEKQVILCSVGTELLETRREDSFCAHAIDQAGLLVVEDAERDDRFRGNPLVVGEPHIRFYAGVPLHGADDALTGALCVIDVVPRTLDRRQRHALETLAREVELHFQMKAHREMLERLNAENASLNAKLQESNNMLNAFMDHAPFLCYIKDASGRFLLFNRNAAEQLNISEEEVLGRRDDDLWPAELAEEYRRHDLEVMRRGRLMETFERTAGRDGRYLYWKSYKFPVPGADGSTMVAGISIDFTQHLERERTLLRTAEENVVLNRGLEATRVLLQTFLDHVPFQSFMKSPDGRYLSYNRVFADYFGITRDEWIGRSMHEVHPEETVTAFNAHDMEVLRGGVPVTVVTRHSDRHGVERTFRSTKFALQDAHGCSVIGGVAYDISEDIERQAQRGRMMASARMAALGLMAGGVAHEINNPLAIIHMAASDLMEELKNDEPEVGELRMSAGHVLETAERIQKIVQSMQMISRDGSQDKLTEHGVGLLLEETLELCRQRFKNSPIALEIAEIDPALRIRCRVVQLGQVLLNLLTNAYDAAHDAGGPGWVRVAATEHEGMVIFSVTDSGHGVPARIRARIMEPFFTTKEVGKGTGLGLSISRTIVAEHGGTLKLNEDGGPTCFVFQVPVVREGKAA